MGRVTRYEDLVPCPSIAGDVVAVMRVVGTAEAIDAALATRRRFHDRGGRPIEPDY
jgi:hypothetical protein